MQQLILPGFEQAVRLPIPEGEHVRKATLAFEQQMREQSFAEGPEDWPLRHFFSPSIGKCSGIYGREIFMRAGLLLAGKIHRYSHIFVITQGEVIVFTEKGKERFVAPHVGIAPAYVKRLLLTIKDTRWMTFHGTDDTDLEIIERNFIVKPEEAYAGYPELQKLLAGEAKPQEVEI